MLVSKISISAWGHPDVLSLISLLKDNKKRMENPTLKKKWSVASKTAFATVKSTIDNSNSSNTVVVFLKYTNTISVNNWKSGKTVMTLTWYRHFQRNGGSNQILRPQTSCFHYGLKVPVVTITVFSILARPCLFSYPLLLTFHMH